MTLERMRKVKGTDFFSGQVAVDMDRFIQHLFAREYSDMTRLCYLAGIEDFAKRGYTQFDQQSQIRFKQELISEGKKGKTVNARIYALNAFNRFMGQPLLQSVKINDDPFATNGMELDDYFDLIDNLLKDGQYSWYILVKVLAGTGMRIGEATYVTFGDIRRGSCMVYGKGGKPRTVYFSHTLRENLWMYIADKADDEKLITYSLDHIRAKLLHFKKKYGLKCNVSPHEYRRFFARNMYENTQDAALVKGLLGHENINMTSHYIKKTEKQARRMLAKSQNW